LTDINYHSVAQIYTLEKKKKKEEEEEEEDQILHDV
jgi:hypothetical protein